MTNREFYEKVMATIPEGELHDFAKSSIAKLDTKNEKRRNTPSKATLENAPFKAKIMEILKGAELPMTANDILVAMDIEGFTINKVNGLCGTLVKEGKVAKDIESGVPKSKAKTTYIIVG